MAKAEASVEELVGMIERGELRLPEMQRRYVWRSTRVRDLLDSLYRGYPSGAILLWETDEAVPLQDFAVAQQANPYQSTRLLLDGQQRLTSLSAVIRGDLVTVRGRRRPIELLFNLEHPDDFSVVTEVNEDQDDDEDEIEDETDSTEDELQRRYRVQVEHSAIGELAGYFDDDLSGYFLAFHGPNHKQLEWGARELRAEHWSSRAMSYDDVQALLGKLRGFKARKIE
jgi:hypothetical protein